MPYLVMEVSEEERDKILKAGYEHAFHHEIDQTLADPMGFAIWLPGDPMDWLVLEGEEEEGDVLVRLPGGASTMVPLSEALGMLPELLADYQRLWEERIPGKDAWPGTMHTSLCAAVEASIPHYREIGLTLAQAILVAMDSGLVLSTETADDEGY